MREREREKREETERERREGEKRERRMETGTLTDNFFNCGGARGVVVIVVGNGHGDTSSNPGQG